MASVYLTPHVVIDTSITEIRTANNLISFINSNDNNLYLVTCNNYLYEDSNTEHKKYGRLRLIRLSEYKSYIKELVRLATATPAQP